MDYIYREKLKRPRIDRLFRADVRTFPEGVAGTKTNKMKFKRLQKKKKKKKSMLFEEHN